MTPALEALYAAQLGVPSLPAIEATVTIRPQLAPRIAGISARQARNVPARLTRSTASQSVNRYRSTEATGPKIPAEQTRTWTAPLSATVASAAAAIATSLLTSTRVVTSPRASPRSQTSI